MRQHLIDAAATAGVVTRAQALALGCRPHVVQDAVKDGVLTAVFPGVYALPARAGNRDVRRRAALAYLPDAGLSHLDGLDLWNGPVPRELLQTAPVHVTRGWTAPVRQPGLHVHRRRNFATQQLFEQRPSGLVVVSHEQAIIESWPLIPVEDRRAPLIVALRDKRMPVDGFLSCLARQPKTAGAAEMRHVARLVADGCHSELELWGHEHVFDHPRLRHALRQHPITVNGRRMRLDRYLPAEMLDVELDGAAYHGRPGQRERDLARDAVLATVGILTVRYGHRRLHSDPAGVQQELLAIMRMRRRQLGVE